MHTFTKELILIIFLKEKNLPSFALSLFVFNFSQALLSYDCWVFHFIFRGKSDLQPRLWNISVLPSRLAANVTLLAAILTVLMISDFFYLAATTVIFFNRYAVVDNKIRPIVFVLNYIDRQAHIATNKNHLLFIYFEQPAHQEQLDCEFLPVARAHGELNIR